MDLYRTLCEFRLFYPEVDHLSVGNLKTLTHTLYKVFSL